MTKVIMSCLILILSLLQYQLWFGESSFFKMIKLNKLYSAQFKVNKLLEHENKELFVDYNNLKSGSLLIEEIARKDLGYVKQDEKYFKIN